MASRLVNCGIRPSSLRRVVQSLTQVLGSHGKTPSSVIYRHIASTSLTAQEVESTKPATKFSKYGGRYTVTLIPGDGIGPELAACVKQVFKYANVPVDFEEILVSGIISDSSTIQEALTSIKRNGVGLKGVLRTKLDEIDQTSLNVFLRRQLDLFANVVYCKSLPGVKTRHDNVDIVVIRENTEGEYSGLEHESVPGVVEGLKIITREKSQRIAKYAFDFATRNNRKKVTAIHKANIMKLSDGLFLRECEKVSELYPNIEFSSMIIDNCCMQLVSNPWQFDVMVMPNLYGNIVSNIGAGLVGGAGLCAGKNVGQEYILFEQGARHTGLELAFQNVANPTAMLLSSTRLLSHLGLFDHAHRIETAILSTIQSGVCTKDIGGSASTSTFVQTVIENLPEETKSKIEA